MQFCLLSCSAFTQSPSTFFTRSILKSLYKKLSKQVVQKIYTAIFMQSNHIYHLAENFIHLFPQVFFAFLILSSPYAAIQTHEINGVETTGRTLKASLTR